MDANFTINLRRLKCIVFRYFYKKKNDVNTNIAFRGKQIHALQILSFG